VDLTKKVALYSVLDSPYPEYKDNQIFASEIKLNNVNYEHHLQLFRTLVKELPAFSGGSVRVLCHGIRNGSEVVALKDLLRERYRSVQVLGTDINPRVNDFNFGIHMDFQNKLPVGLGKFDVIFSNSLDQAFDPKLALSNWLSSLSSSPTSRLVLFSSALHGKMGTGKLDPFSCEPEFFPFVFLEWFDKKACVERILFPSNSESRDVLFLIKRID